MKKSCSFFGHRNVVVSEELRKQVEKVVEDLILSHNVVTFLFGSRSEFDSLCHEVVTSLKEKYPHIKRVVYTCKSEACVIESEREQMEKIYWSALKKQVSLHGMEEEVEHKTKYTAGRASYVERNYAMIDDSDYCVFYYDEEYEPEIRKYSRRSIGYYQPKSGTALAYAYAKQKKKNIINVFKK